jgi:hypothetical protein
LAACAAVLTLMVSGWFLLSPTSDLDRVGDVETLVAMVSEEEMQIGNDREEDARMQEIVRQLLIMEGFGEESTVEEEFLQSEPQPITLQWHNTRVFLKERYG